MSNEDIGINLVKIALMIYAIIQLKKNTVIQGIYQGKTEDIPPQRYAFIRALYKALAETPREVLFFQKTNECPNTEERKHAVDVGPQHQLGQA
ncbi:MAG: hypothetical protein NDI77_08030 [Geobacteraceae bacterium]|nr:hypothetical protein [Geobacteraceae bacterium]